MARLTSLITIAVALFTASINAQSILCSLFGLSPLQCAICGYTPSSPIYCVAYNATFESAPPGPLVATYKNTNWPGFSVLTQASSPAPKTVQQTSGSTKTQDSPKRGSIIKKDLQQLTHKAGVRDIIRKSLPEIISTPQRRRSLISPVLGSLTVSPASPRNYGAIAPNTNGSLIFGKEGGIDAIPTNGQKPAGTLYTFSYACALPNTNPPVAAPCSVKVSGYCLPKGGFDFVNGPFIPYSKTYAYDPGLLTPGGPTMKDMRTSFSQEGFDKGLQLPQKCQNYTFSATPAVGLLSAIPPVSVALLLDNIVFNTYATGYR